MNGEKKYLTYDNGQDRDAISSRKI